MKKWFQEPIHKKIYFLHEFYRFFVDFGTPWGPQGGTFLGKKKTQMSVTVSDPRPFRGASFSVWVPSLEKVVFLTPSGPHFGGIVGDFLVKNVTFGLEFCSLLLLHPLHLTAQLVLTITAFPLHFIVKNIQNILNILNIPNIPNIPNIQVISQFQTTRPGGMREAIRRPPRRGCTACRIRLHGSRNFMSFLA